MLNPVITAFYPYRDFYETRSISKTRKDKTCHICGTKIPKGSSNVDYKFYCDDGSYPTVPVCMRCEQDYEIELRTFMINGISESDLQELREHYDY